MFRLVGDKKILNVPSSFDTGGPEESGNSFLLIRGDNDSITEQITRTGRFGGKLWDEVKWLVDTNRSIIDAGANLGSFAVEFAKLTNKTIHCFEPQKDVYYQLGMNLLLNSCLNSITYNIGLGSPEQNGTHVGLFDSPPRNNGGTQLSGANMPIFNQGSKNIVVAQVPVRSLDTIFPEASHESIGFIKIDVEGFEYFLIRGAEILIARDRPVMVIECFENFPEGKTFKLIKEMKYNIYRATSGQDDFICIPEESKHNKILSNAKNLDDVAVMRQNNNFSGMLNLLESVDIKSLTVEQTIKYYDEKMIALWYTDKRDPTEESSYHGVGYIFIDYLNSLDEKDISKHTQAHIKSNISFLIPKEYKTEKIVLVESFHVFRMSLTELQSDVEYIVKSKDYDEDSLWTSPHFNPVMQRQ